MGNKKSYYKRFRIILANPLSRIYHRWTYRKAIEDLNKLKFKLNFSKKSFTCLLCGVGNENTADEFIKFVISKNKNPKIIIIDKGDEQINAVIKLANSKYPDLQISIKQIDALKLTSFIKRNSVDWIETDGFLEYFNKKAIGLLLIQWQKILSEKGFITFRDTFNQNGFDWLIDYLRIRIAMIWLGVTVYSHSKKSFEGLIKKTGFNYITNPTIIATFLRYTLTKR